MAGSAPAEVGEVLSSFTEIMSGLMIDQYQKQLTELELTLPQAQVLRVLRRGPLQTGQLAAELRISAPAITQLTDRLIRKGLIERSAAADDRRCVIVALSAEGRRLVDSFRQRRRKIFDEALADLSESERRQAFEVLEKVVRVLESYESGASFRPGNNSMGKKETEISS
ncbi:MAG TPA: MarR family transcriptional regulator [Pyrinomonadaceae bacterium]|nr:MarR family transcriptional regulator [Pyrinomonadaceae bacterium]